MSRHRWELRDAALGYASRGIPVLPLHYPLARPNGFQSVGRDQSRAVGTGCSCRDPGCGQIGKHPLGSLVPHGVKDATCNRARVLAWWVRHPQANIGLATGHRFDVLDVDGPAGAQAIRTLAAQQSLQSSGPLVRTGGGGWHFYLAPIGLGNASPAGLEHVDWRGRGGYVVAPPSRHASGHPYRWAQGAISTPHPARCPRCCWSGSSPANPSDQQPRSTSQSPLTAQVTAMRGPPSLKNWRGSPPLRWASATASCWESTRNLYNLVATGALDHREVDQGLLQAAERCGLLADEPRQTCRTLASGRQVGLAHPGRPAQPTDPERTHPSPRSLRAMAEQTKERG